MRNSLPALKSKKSHIISSVISPAVRLWLRSQVEDLAALQFKIQGGDREILTGHIPSVSIAATSAIYQGLHLTEIELEGTNIRCNLGEVFKGKALRLLEPLPVSGKLLLLEKDLQASLCSPLLSNALSELLDTFLKVGNLIHPPQDFPSQQIHWQDIKIDTGHITLSGILPNSTIGTTPVTIHAGLILTTPQELQLNPLSIQLSSNQPPIILDGFRINLGPEVDIEELILTPGKLICRGGLKVMP
jgi:LmeA-like phospholipid-binding